MTNSTIDLDKLERLEREATPGPWFSGVMGDDPRDPTEYFAIGPEHWIGGRDPESYRRAGGAAGRDAKLIKALRNAAPALFAELRAARKRIAELERDARLGAVVRAEVANTNTYGHVPALDLDVRAAGARARGDYAIGYLLSAIADAIRAEEGGEHG